ncbi:hypothetical protein DL546_009744 [Coniochaeta pulveracea]|uniref:Uncharacterized protein n=1 Tax=Coniochaeta pulveracea TaxID=177199 RepID=A0A420YN49_9PEZI|nr:hypothetical protein DL546_009744 [Coniochaeta pulveracea]
MWNLISPLSDTLDFVKPASRPEACPFSRNGYKRKLPAFETASCPRAFRLPPPILEVDFRLVCNFSDTLAVGPSTTGLGKRNWIRLDGGQFNGTWGSGLVVPGGHSEETVESDLNTHVETHHLLQTDDGAFIEVHMDGWRTVGVGQQGSLEKQCTKDCTGSIDPADLDMRLYVYLQTGHERYRALNTAMWVASGAMLGDRIVYDAYRVL